MKRAGMYIAFAAAVAQPASAQPVSSPPPTPPVPMPPSALTLRDEAVQYAAQQAKQAAEEKAAAVEEAKEETTKKEALRQFAGINFGVAIGLLYAVNEHRVETAELQPSGGEMVVRATVSSRAAARVLLETHYFFSPKGYPRFGHGPFIALQPGTDELIVSVGLGYMIGFRRAEDKSDSFNLGLALMVEPGAKVLGPGVEENKPLPDGETTIRFQQKSVSSVAFVGSFSF